MRELEFVLLMEAFIQNSITVELAKFLEKSKISHLNQSGHIKDDIM
jgi:hypothetical protein